MLRIVCCSVPGQLRKETRAALQAFTPIFVDIAYSPVKADDDTDYGRVLAAHWTQCVLDGLALAIVEPDIVVRPDVIDAFLNCPCEYGGFPYSWGPEVGIALGCTRFRAEFIQRYPDLMARAVAKGVGWQQFDVVVQRHLLVREHGEQPHICGATVEHLNPLKQLRPDGNPTPLASLPAW